MFVEKEIGTMALPTNFKNDKKIFKPTNAPTYSKKDKKAQVSLEFLFVLAVVLILFTLVLSNIVSKRNQITETKEILEKKDLCLEIASMITETYSKGIGTEIILPINAKHLRHTIWIQPMARNLFIGDKDLNPVYCTYPIKSVTNNPVNKTLPWFSFSLNSKDRFLKMRNLGDRVMITLHNSSEMGQ